MTRGCIGRSANTEQEFSALFQQKQMRKLLVAALISIAGVGAVAAQDLTAGANSNKKGRPFYATRSPIPDRGERGH
jgi:hypothetical protein